MKQRVLRELKAFRAPIAILMTYAIVRLAFGWHAGSRGLLAADGSLDAVSGTLGLATLALRGLVLVLVPALVVYKIILRVMTPPDA